MDSKPEACDILDESQWCTKCGYALRGQPLIHEPHYGLLVVKCPECADVRAIQAAPIPRAVARALGIGRVTWFLVRVLLWILITSLAWSVTAYEVGEAASQPIRSHLRNASGSNWDEMPPERLEANVERMGGWITAIDWRAAWLLLLAIPLAVGSALLACVCFPAARSRGTLIAVLTAAIIALVEVTVGFVVDRGLSSRSNYTYVWVRVGLPSAICSITVFATATFIALLLVRPFLRVFLRFIGDPVLLVRASTLWTMDGKAPPIDITPMWATRK